MLREIVEDPLLAWKKGSFDPLDFSTELTTDALAELEAFLAANPGEKPDHAIADGDLPLVREIIESGKDEYIHKPGYFVLTGLADSSIPEAEWKRAFRVFTSFVGEQYPQDGRTLEVKEVRNRGKSLDQEGARYSDGNHGGSLHTDGAERALPAPDYFGLMFVRQGMRGGDSQLISAYSVHNELMQSHPDLLPLLYEPFHFDLRGDIDDLGNRTAEKPIFFDNPRNPHGLGFTYLRDYIDAGHAYEEVPDLTPDQVAALDAVDRLIDPASDNPLIVEGMVPPGSTVFFNNTTTIHGRTAFQDYPEPERRRLLYRSWLSERE